MTVHVRNTNTYKSLLELYYLLSAYIYDLTHLFHVEKVHKFFLF